MGLNLRGLIGTDSKATPVQEKTPYYTSAFINAVINEMIVDKNAMKAIPVLKRASEMIVNLISGLDLQILQTDDRGKVSYIEDERTAFFRTVKGKQILINLIEDSLFYGTGYAYTKWELNKLKDVIYISPENVSVSHYSTDPLNPIYELNVQGIKVKDDYHMIRLVNGYSEDGGLSGEGGWINAKEIIKLYYRLLKGSQNITSEKLKIFRSNNRLSKEAFDVFKQHVKQANENEGTLILNEGVEVSESKSHSAQENQFMQLFDKLDDLLCIETGLNKQVVLSQSLPDQYNQFIRATVIPVIQNLIYSLNDVMLLEVEKNDTTFYVNTDCLMIASAKDRAMVDKIYVESGIKSRSEVRGDLNLDYVEVLDNFVMSQGSVLVGKDGTIINFNLGTQTNIQDRKGGEVDGIKTD